MPMDEHLQWITTKEGQRFDVGERIQSGYTKYTIIGFGFKDGHLWFWVESESGSRQAHAYFYLGKPQFRKIPQPKTAKPEKEKPGLYFDRVKGFEVVKSDDK
jgi:hypothetical protein